MYALVTGGTRGIGFAVSQFLASRGYGLIVTFVHDEDSAERARENLLSLGASSVVLVQVDLGDEEAVACLSNEVRSASSSLDVLVFNAGITSREKFGGISRDSWDSVFNINVDFPVFFLQEIIDLIPRGGCVVFTGSLMGKFAHGTSLAYGVSKAATDALVKNLVKFLAPYGVRVNGVAPGFVDTDWQKNKPAHIRRSIESKVALGRFCEPEELMGAYEFLIDNSYVNGEIVVVDGGYCYQ